MVAARFQDSLQTLCFLRRFGGPLETFGTAAGPNEKSCVSSEFGSSPARDQAGVRPGTSSRRRLQGVGSCEAPRYLPVMTNIAMENEHIEIV